MLILDKPRSFKSTTIRIPLYHRGHLSLFKGARVWLCFIPALETGQFSELIISPIHHDSWSDLWRITITLYERVGLVHDVFKILADNNINIITAESSSRERLSLHSIEIIASAKLYSSPYNDGTHEERSNGNLEELSDLRRELLARLIDDIAFLPSGQPWLKIGRVRNLLNARRNYNRVLTQVQLKHHFKPMIMDTNVNKSGKGSVTISLPEPVRNKLFEALEIPRRLGMKPQGNYLMVSNTTDRFLRVYFMKKGERIIAPTIEHQDEIGALAAITDAIQTSNFNILTSLSRLYQWGALARTEFVLQPPKELQNADEKTIKEYFESALRTQTLIDGYNVSIGYPENYVTPLKTKRITLSNYPRSARSSYPNADSENRSIESILNSRYRELAQRVSSSSVKADDILRYQLVQNLVAEETTAKRAKETDSRGTLFISYSFQESDLFYTISKAAKKNHFNIITGKELGGFQRNRDGIIKLIQRCTHFLGIWTEERRYEVNGKYFPSPWLHWELGVADGLGKRWHLLISDRVHEDSWKRIAGETPHTIFGTSTFDQKLKVALQSLSSNAQ